MHNTAHIFCVGRELLEGLVLDRNANFLAGKLHDAGCHVTGIQVINDVAESMINAFRHVLASKPRYVLTTGGMGPGHDDNTREAVAKAAGLSLHQDERAVEMLTAAYRRLAAKGVVEDPTLNETRLRMAVVPEGAVCYENPIGAAPAVRLRVDETLFFMLPGQPQEMQRLFNLYVLPAIRAEGEASHKMARHIEYPGRDESALTRVLGDLSRRYPGVHSRARLHGPDDAQGIRITLFGEHADEHELSDLLERAEADMRARLGLEIQGTAPRHDASHGE